MNINLQQVLENDRMILRPLSGDDFEALYAVAADPQIWEQHPQTDRWKKEVFRVFFNEAMASNGAFKIVDKYSSDIAGSTRFYEYNKEDDSILIGYTFYATRYWGKGINLSVKACMLDYIFSFVSKVFFYVGNTNIRSQIAVTRLGAEKVGEQEADRSGEIPKLNFVYRITREDWLNKKSKG